jgi:DNA ligase D-like protein (predicted polymerase)
MAAAVEREVLQVAGREVAVSNPGKVYFPEAGITKIEVVRYYLAVAEGALRGAGGRPNVLVRYANGIHGEFFFQKRAPASRPEWVETVALRFPSGREAEEIVPRDAAALAWMANLGCLELHPHPVRAEDLDHPDELRVDLDPMPGVEWDQIRRVAEVTREALADLGLVGWPKTSGSRGVHVNVRIHRRWSFTQVRRAALALAREVERRAPSLATHPSACRPPCLSPAPATCTPQSRGSHPPPSRYAPASGTATAPTRTNQGRPPRPTPSPARSRAPSPCRRASASRSRA